jgi:RNA recognition motif-containing protein
MGKKSIKQLRTENKPKVTALVEEIDTPQVDNDEAERNNVNDVTGAAASSITADENSNVKTSDLDNEDTNDILKRKRKRKRPSKVAPEETDNLGSAQSTSLSQAQSDSSVPVTADHYVNEKTVYIEGLPYESTEAEITEFFESCGKIVSIRLPRW